MSKPRLELEIGRLSLAEIYAALPGKGECKELDLMIGSTEWGRVIDPPWADETLAKQVDHESVERTRLLFRRLGELEGEDALGHLLEKYGKEEGFTGLAMTFAILGWMNVDRDDAIHAFQQLNRSNTPSLPSMKWRDETVLTGFGGLLRPAIVQFAIREVMWEATRDDPERGMGLLGEYPWNYHVNFNSGVTGFIQGISEGLNVDWIRLHSSLSDLVDDRQRERVGRNETSQVLWNAEASNLDLTLARLWAEKDLDAAIDWYVHDLEGNPSSESAVSRTLAVFDGVPRDDRGKVLRWIEKSQGGSDWDDSLIVSYALRWAMEPPDDFVDRLVALPDDEQTRIEIVNRYSFSNTKDHRVVTRISAPQVHRLIEAAQLSDGARTELLNKLDEAVLNTNRMTELDRFR